LPETMVKLAGDRPKTVRSFDGRYRSTNDSCGLPDLMEDAKFRE
jgi:hypothetical protein